MARLEDGIYPPPLSSFEAPSGEYAVKQDPALQNVSLPDKRSRRSCLVLLRGPYLTSNDHMLSLDDVPQERDFLRDDALLASTTIVYVQLKRTCHLTQKRKNKGSSLH